MPKKISTPTPSSGVDLHTPVDHSSGDMAYKLMHQQRNHARLQREDQSDLVMGADKTINGLPRETGSRLKDIGPRQPALWAEHEVLDDPVTEGVYGAYPKGFLKRMVLRLGCKPRDVVHVCSGTLTKKDTAGGLRVDLRKNARPDIIADARALPFKNNSIKGMMIDPPYSKEYARDLYQTDYPRPAHILAEAARVVKPCGRIGFLHFLIPVPPPGCKILRVVAISQGCGYRIRAFTIYEKEQDRLL